MLENFLIFPNLVNKKAAQRFIQTYAKENNWHEIDKTTGNLGFAWIHYALIRVLQPERILCIGSRYGYIPAICALACKDNQLGVVDFVDAGFDENNPNHDNHWGGVGTWKKINPARYFAKFGLSPYIQLHITTTQQFAKTNKHRWGYIYIDGDHSYEGVTHDFKAFWPRLQHGGTMAFHDIYVKRMGTLVFGVHRLWKELKHNHPNATLELPGAFGLGILQKPR